MRPIKNKPHSHVYVYIRPKYQCKHVVSVCWFSYNKLIQNRLAVTLVTRRQHVGKKVIDMCHLMCGYCIVYVFIGSQSKFWFQLNIKASKSFI